MPFRIIDVILVLLVLCAPGVVTCSQAASAAFFGDADISYIKYDAEIGNAKVFSGSSLAKKFSLGYNANNIYYKDQPNFYDVTLGYQWIDFNTKVTDLDSDVNLKQSYGKFYYLGDVAYNPAGFPIQFRAYRHDHVPITPSTGFFSNNLINDNLMFNIAGRGKSITTGGSLVFDPRKSESMQLRGLPLMMVDYRETTNQVSEGGFRLDDRTRELGVAGLNRENNWLQFRSLEYENFLNSKDNYTQQKIQIGLVDFAGRRKWSTITNWIDISVDGQLTTTRNPSRERDIEEYDLNFMAIASRRTWDARTFMNYNRTLDSQALTETARVPVYVKGLYGSDATWFFTVEAGRGREQRLNEKGTNTAYSNSVSAGGTMFNRESFTLSPAISLQTFKAFRGDDGYSIVSSLDTTSTSRFSDKVVLNARMVARAKDDGANNPQSQSWSNSIYLQAVSLKNSDARYTVQDTIDSGSGSGYLDNHNIHLNPSGKVGNYLRNSFRVSAYWIHSANFSTSLEGMSDIISASNLPTNNNFALHYQTNLDRDTTSYLLDSKYESFDNGSDPVSYNWVNKAQIQYRPDSYREALLRIDYTKRRSFSISSSDLELLQRYTYNVFAKSGVIRKVATFFQEYSIIGGEVSGFKRYTQYLLLSGRYNPTERLSLNGAVKYQRESPLSVSTVYCWAGISTDFRLLSASLDYTLAKRDLDHRLEKRLQANVHRSF